MTLSGGAIAAVTAIVAVACQPFYRDDLVRGRASSRATSGARKLFDRAWEARSAGDKQGCVKLARRAIAINPNSGASAYHGLARCEFDAGQRARARATARRGLELHAGNEELRDFLITAYQADQLIANTLDFVEPPSIDSATAAGLTELAELVEALHKLRKDPIAAVELYLRWFDAYGVPDHRLIRKARDRLLAGAARHSGISSLTSGLLSNAEGHAAAGAVDIAMRFYTHAYRLLPETVVTEHHPGFFTTAARVTNPRAIAPAAVDYAEAGNRALRKQELGAAIHAYRRAVAAAPWWAPARRNLGMLLNVAGQEDEAEHQFMWARRLEGK